jgi:hypothetical protein
MMLSDVFPPHQSILVAKEKAVCAMHGGNWPVK